MSTEGAATLLAEIVRLWLRDAATDHQERRDLAHFLDLPEQTVAQLARPDRRNWPTRRNDGRRALLRGTLHAPNFR